jgi:hypothetical protein
MPDGRWATDHVWWIAFALENWFREEPIFGQVLPETLRWEGGSNVQFRRRAPRQPATWDGVCQIEGELAARCRVIDISMLGLSITLEHPSPAQLAGLRIYVDVPTVIGDSFSLRLEGKIANAKATRGRAARVGIEFDQPSEGGLGTTILESTMSEDTEAGARRSDKATRAMATRRSTNPA